jgi:hypothetical protein
MSDLSPGGMFDRLDDPAPPAFGNDLLPGVMQRGQQLRHQRRMAYTVGSACAMVLVAGSAVGLAATGGHDGKQVIPLVTSTPTQHHTKKPHHPHPQSPSTTPGVTQPGGGGNGGHHPPKPCVTPTPTPADAAPTATPTASDTDAPTPTSSPTPGSDSTTSPAPTPVDTTCPSPTATPTDSPPATETPTPTYSLPPLLPGIPQPRGSSRSGIS